LGQLLRVNLNEGKVRSENLLDVFPEDVLKKYVGCFGLGLRFLYDNLRLGFKPTDPENPFIFMTGPLTGVPSVPACTNTTITTLNADTMFTCGRSHSHGYWGPQLKFAGFDGVIIEGSSPEPVYLWINDGKGEIRDAHNLWSKDTHQTEDLVREELGRPRASVAAIGPAGEHMATGALIANDRNHSFSHSGVGTVMGSKKMKAIAVFGSGRIPIANEEKLKNATKNWRENLFKSEVAQGRETVERGRVITCMRRNIRSPLRRTSVRSVLPNGELACPRGR